mgnify:CR=1 FL=1
MESKKIAASEEKPLLKDGSTEPRNSDTSHNTHFATLNIPYSVRLFWYTRDIHDNIT